LLRRQTVLVATSSLLLGALWSAAPAAATDRPGTRTAVEGRYCVVDLSPDAARAPEENRRCHSTFTDAIADATGGRVTDAPATTELARDDADLDLRIDQAAEPDTVTDGSPFAAAPARSPYVLSIEYSARDYGGDAHIFTATAGCNPGGWQNEYVGNLANDVISSFRTFSGCKVRHFEHRDFEGASLDYQESQAYIGDAMNDQTSSLRWG